MKLISIRKIVTSSVFLILVLVALHVVYYLQNDDYRRYYGSSISDNGNTKLKQNEPSSNKIHKNEVHFRDKQNGELGQKRGEISDSETELKHPKTKYENEEKEHKTGEDNQKNMSSLSQVASIYRNSDLIKRRNTQIGRNGSQMLLSSKLKSNSSSEHSASTYDGHDFLRDPVFTFDKGFKNPCWYDEEELKCLPYFFVIGVKKCGTTSLFKGVCQFPEVIDPGFKESQFFARKRFGRLGDDIKMYIQQFGRFAKLIESKTKTAYLKSNKTIPFITGEGSPSNLHLNSHWMNLPGNENLTEPRYVILDYIKHFLPDAKLIITFRDPIERLYSDYYHEYRFTRKFEKPNPRHFHEVVVNGTQMYKNCFSKRTIRSCVYDPKFYDITKMQIQLGIYFIFWQELLRVFPRDQILVLQNKHLSSMETSLKIQTFLGLDPILSEERGARESSVISHQRRGKRIPMFNETFQLLYRFYKPFNEKMAALTNDEVFLYSHDIN